MPAPRTTALLLALALPLAGCASDYGLALAPPPEPEDPGPGPAVGPSLPDLPDFPDLPDLPDLPDPPDNPWDDLNPGDLPEVYLAVAWSEYECCWYCDYADPMPVEPDIMACWSRFAVVDLRGQVVAEFPLPEEVDQAWSPYSYVNMLPAGPGRFLAVVNNWDTSWNDDDGWPSPRWWEVWLLDAAQNTTTRVAYWDAEFGGVRIEQTGRLVFTGDAGTAPLLGVWPNEPDRLVMWLYEGECPEGAVGELHSFHLFDPEAPVLSWKVEELLPEGLPQQLAGLWPWSLELSVDDEGAPTALMGVTGGWCGSGDTELRLISTSLEEGAQWDQLLWGAWTPIKPTYTGRAGGAALHVPGYAGGLPEWQLIGPEGSQTGPLPDDVLMAIAGPVLDPEGPTFVLVGGSEDGGYHHAIDVIHRGEPVWRIDALRFGLQERQVFFTDVDLLWPVQEE